MVYTNSQMRGHPQNSGMAVRSSALSIQAGSGWTDVPFEVVVGNASGASLNSGALAVERTDTWCVKTHVRMGPSAAMAYEIQLVQIRGGIPTEKDPRTVAASALTEITVPLISLVEVRPGDTIKIQVRHDAQTEVPVNVSGTNTHIDYRSI